MDFPPRLRQILLILLSEERISIQKLAEYVGISKRTTQRELEYIDFYLKKYNLTLQSKSGSGIWLAGNEEDRRTLLLELKEKSELDATNKESRRQKLAYELLRDRDPKKLYYFSNLFGVSEATISRDLEIIEEWFCPYHLKVEKRPGMGVFLSGAEQDYRTAVQEFVSKNLNNPVSRRIFEDEIYLSSSVMEEYEDIKNVFSILDSDVLRRVCLCVSGFRKTRLRRLTQESYHELIIHISITVERLIKGEIIALDETLVREIKSSREFSFALELANALEEEFEIEIPDIEISYIALHLSCAKMQSVEVDEEDHTQDGELLKLIRELIVAYDEALASTLEVDEDLVNGLLTHIKPTLMRVRNSIPIANPHLTEIKKIYPDIFERCRFVGRFLEARLGYSFPESEIGLLVTHFGGAIVRLENERERKRKVHIGLICASGIGIARLMSSRLLKYFGGRIEVTTYGYNDVTPYVKTKTDFFVSSLELEEEECDIVFVNPLILDADLKKIGAKVEAYEKLEEAEDFNQDFTRQLEKINFLSDKIRQVINHFCCLEVNGNLEFRTFLRTAIQKIAENELSADYIEADIIRREEIATQIIPQLGIGLFHARTKGVLHPCVYVCRTTSRESFTNPYMQKIKAAVFMFVPQDDYAEDNSRMLASISGRLYEDGQFLNDVKTADQEVIRHYLNDTLRDYFKNYLNHV